MVALEYANDPRGIYHRNAETTFLVLDGLRFIIAKFESITWGTADFESFRSFSLVAAVKIRALNLILVSHTIIYLIFLYT